MSMCSVYIWTYLLCPKINKTNHLDVNSTDIIPVIIYLKMLTAELTESSLFLCPRLSLCTSAPCYQQGSSAVFRLFKLFFYGWMDGWLMNVGWMVIFVSVYVFFFPRNVWLGSKLACANVSLLMTSRTFQLPSCLHTFNFVQNLNLRDWNCSYHTATCRRVDVSSVLPSVLYCLYDVRLQFTGSSESIFYVDQDVLEGYRRVNGKSFQEKERLNALKECIMWCVLL